MIPSDDQWTKMICPIIRLCTWGLKPQINRTLKSRSVQEEDHALSAKALPVLLIVKSVIWNVRSLNLILTTWNIKSSHTRPRYHKHFRAHFLISKTATDPRLHIKTLSHHVTLIFILPTSNSGNVFFLPSSPAAPDVLQRNPSSLLFPVLSQKLSFIPTVKAGIGNALVGCRQAGRHLNDLISRHIGLVWLRRGEETRQASVRAPQRPLESQFGFCGGYSQVNDHFLSLKSNKMSEEGERKM